MEECNTKPKLNFIVFLKILYHSVKYKFKLSKCRFLTL